MRLSTILLAAIPLTFLACGDAPERIRQATYPPDFRYFKKGEVEGVMQQLAVEVVALEDQMWKEMRTDEDRQSILAILTRMKQLSGELTRGTRSNHPRIDEAAPRLQRDVDRALRGARLDPPNYYFAGEVSGACHYCHEPRHESRRLPNR